MGKTVITIMIVGFMICANFLGLIMFNAQQEFQDFFVDDEILGQESNEESKLNLPNDVDIKEEELPWHLLSQTKNPSARLFVNHEAVAIEFELPKMNLETTASGTLISFEDCDFLMEQGNPQVPEFRFFVAVPHGSYVKEVKIAYAERHQLEGKHVIAPYIPQILDGISLPMEANFEVYSSNELFPESQYDIRGPDKLRHIDALEVSLYPVRCRPASGVVEVCNLLRLIIYLEFEEGFSSPLIPEGDELDKNLLELVANPEDVSLCSSSYFSSPSTRAPSTIYHTLGFHGSAGSINTSKDTTTGNGAGVPLLSKDDDIYYDAEAGKTMYIDGFDIGSADSAADLEYAMLHLEYVGTNNYDGSSYVRWALEGDPLKNTNIQPTDLNGSQSGDLSYNLLGHAGSPSIVNDIVDLDIEFTENGTGGGSKDIPFDYIWIEFAYREELTGNSDYLIVTDMALADELRPLSEFKTQRMCIDTQVYDTNWINSNWNGSNLKERIHDFIRSMYENYSIEWVLLGGDDTDVPTDTSKYDNYYADVVGYMYPDLSLGRLPSSEDELMQGMVEDIIEHQRDMRSWKNRMYLVGTNVFSTGDGKVWMEYLKNNSMLEHGFTFYEDYEVEGNNSNSRTIDHYNMGMGMSNYYGHGSPSVWTRNNGSSTLITKNDVIDDFDNSEKRGFVWTLSCSTAKYMGSGTSIGETWIIQRNGGGIGYIGGAEIVYVSPGKGLHRAFWREYDNMMDNGEVPTQGEVHFRSQNTNYYRIYVLYGDPQVGLSLTKPELDIAVGSFESGSFEEKIGFDQNEQVTIDTLINFKSVLPKGVHINVSVHNKDGDIYYLDEVFIDDPEDAEQKIFWNWTVPSSASSGIYNVTVRTYNVSQGWDFVLENRTYFFVGYLASMIWLEQVNSEVIEGDTVCYRIHIDNLLEPIPGATVWVYLEGRDYEPYKTPFSYGGFNTTTISAGLDVIVEVEIPVLEPGTYAVSANLTIDWALMDSISANDTQVRGIRILEVLFNHPIYFREDNVNVSYRYFAYSDFIVDTTLDVEAQTNIIYNLYPIENGTNWLNFSWTIQKFLPNDTYDMDLEITGFSRSLEVKADSIRIVVIREILDLGENWLIPRQQPSGGWNESEWGWPPGQDYNETARVIQALIWSGVNPMNPIIQDAADYVLNSLNLSIPGSVDDFAQTIWALVEAGRGSSKKVQDSAEILRKMQNWIYEPENWTLFLNGWMANESWEANISGYDSLGNLMYRYYDNDTINSTYYEYFINFSVLPNTAKLNITINITNSGLNSYLFPPLYKKDYPWGGDPIWINDFDGRGGKTGWNYTKCEEIEFDRGWGETKGTNSIAGYTAWAVIGLLQNKTLAPTEYEALTTGVAWLLDNQSADGSWFPYAMDSMWGWAEYEYPGFIAGSGGADFIQNTAISVIALVMNGTLGAAVEDAVAYLKTQQAQNGSYPYSPYTWALSINIVSTAHTMRALRRTGYVFELKTPYVREAARWLCSNQKEYSGNWEVWGNFTRTSSEAIMALACLRFSQTMELTPGWNLISLPLILDDTSLASVLESIEGDYDAVQYFDANDPNDSWKNYQIDKPSCLNDLNEIDHEMGFWVHITNPAGATLVYNGTEPKRNQDISIREGWNLIGYPSLSYRKRDIALSNMNFGPEVDAIWTYESSTQKWVQLENSDYLVPENGYWVHSKVNKNWIVPL
jgi:hypothetical protein